MPLLDGGVAILSSNSIPCLYLASAVALAHQKHLAFLPTNLRFSRKATLVWAKSAGKDDSGWKNKSKGLDLSNLMSSVDAEKGPAHAQVLSWKEKQQEGTSAMQMSKYGQPIGEKL